MKIKKYKKLILLFTFLLVASFQFSCREDIVSLLKHTNSAVVTIQLDNGKQGTGFLISENGYILTNRHIIEGFDTANITFGDDTLYQGTIIEIHEFSDIALLKIEDSGEDFNYLFLGNSDDVVVGEVIISIGTAFGDLTHTLSKGIVTYLNRMYTDNEVLIQLDNHINPGMSGGPTINLKGEVIGINTFLISPVEAVNVGISLITPINEASILLEMVGLSSLIEATNTFNSEII